MIYTLVHIYSSHGAFAVAFDSDISLEVAKFYRVKVKALSKRLLCTCHPHPSGTALRLACQRGNDCKGKKKNRNLQGNRKEICNGLYEMGLRMYEMGNGLARTDTDGGADGSGRTRTNTD